MEWQAVFFDFDGVILDSVDVKTQAFAQMFRKYGKEIEEAVVRYHLENGGVSRYEKFQYYYKYLLKKVISDTELSDLGQQFSELVVEKVVASRFVFGALETLECLARYNIPAYIVSGTPQEELELIVNKRELSKYFKEVHGSPGKKWEITCDILKRKAFSHKKCLFIGDALSDHEAAQYNGLHFLGIVDGDASGSIFPGNTITDNKVDLERFAERIYNE